MGVESFAMVRLGIGMSLKDARLKSPSTLAVQGFQLMETFRLLTKSRPPRLYFCVDLPPIHALEYAHILGTIAFGVSLVPMIDVGIQTPERTPYAHAVIEWTTFLAVCL